MPPSHLQLLWMQSPFAHWNSWALQRTVVLLGCPPQFSGHSSDPSVQSLSPSQRQRASTHTELLHWKELPLQVGLGQETSSEPSEQSLSLSQTNEVDIHWPLAHLNSSALHCLAAGEAGQEEERCYRDVKAWVEFSLLVTFQCVVKCVNVFPLNLTAVCLISTVATISLAVTVPAFWYTLVHRSATVVLWLQAGFRFWGQKQEVWHKYYHALTNREIRPVTDLCND